MNKYKNMWFMQADSGGGDGGEAPAGDAGLSPGMTAFEPVTKTTTVDREPPETKPSKVPAQSEPEPVEPPQDKAPQFDASKFAKEFGQSLSETLKPVLAPKEPEMTPEKARELLKIWEPDENWYKRYDNLETRADAVVQMRDGLVAQADTLAQYRMREMIDQLREEIAPGLQTVTQTANQQREERFKTTYPQLASSALNPLVRSIAQDFIGKGQTFQTEDELFKALATGVEAVMKISNPEFKLEAAANGSQQQQPKDRGGRNLPVTSPGGGGGTGRRAGGDQQAKPRGLAIFDK